MATPTNNYYRFQTKVTLTLISCLLFVLLLSNTLIYSFAWKAQFNEIRFGLMMLAQTSALTMDTDAIDSIPLNHEGIQSSAFTAIQQQLKRIQKANPRIKYIYIMKKTETPGTWQFVVDADPLSIGEKGIIKTSLPGDLFNASRFPEMLKAFEGPSSDTKLEVDEWGASLSGYAPIKNSQGKAIAMLGLDVASNEIYQIEQETQKRILMLSLFGVLLSLVIGMLFSKTITRPIEKLVKGTAHLAEGNLQYRVEVSGNDEIAQLAVSFNQMTRNLYKSRRRILGYFSNIVRALIRVLEARDQYTQGHSQTVAEHAGKIALRMGFPKEDVKFFKKMAVLHDIGKVGIRDNILNKPEGLTPEEWEKIKQHPVMGEEILRPVLNNPKMLSVVRHHHERYDGQGYPDKLKGDEINILAAIVSVADAYHAMVSDRSYRKAMSHAEAAAELKKFRGTQFNPKVVDIFLEILKEEGIV